jgi:putative colanic acid biosynthesis acetyltransferase WcaF
MAKISIGEKAIISQQAYLCGGTHDISSPHFQLVARDITIGANSWVAARAFIGPGVTIAEGSVVGGGSVVFRDTEPFGVYVGNPAKLLKRRSIIGV